MRIAAITLCVFLLLAVLSNCGRGTLKRKAVFIFCDVTNSLNKTESETVASMASGVLNTLQPGTEYRIYPILAETERLVPINDKESTIQPKSDNESLQSVLEKRRQEDMAKKLTNLYQVTNTNKNDNRTCILNAISFAGQQFNDFPKDKYDRELIIISDMLEECDNTPLKRQIDIRKGDITEELKQANNFPQGTDLSDVSISIITPATEETYVKYQPGSRPPMDSLKEFWRLIFNGCNVSPEAQKNTEKYFWSNGILPRRFSVKK
jgi:hypothetical protein